MSRTSPARRVALIGDHDPAVSAHRAIPLALATAARMTGRSVDWRWIGTETIRDAAADLAGFDAVWCVPASPYRRMTGALAAIRHAREHPLPFLGTCGGFQHALIEFARHAAGIPAADHAETAPGTCHVIRDKCPAPAVDLVITPLPCSLVGQSGSIVFVPGSRLHRIFDGLPATEGYHCSYGVNPVYRRRLEAAGLRFTGFAAADRTFPADDTAVPVDRGADAANAGGIRAFELPGHPFFVGTLFQPERSALSGQRHPLVEAFVMQMG